MSSATGWMICWRLNINSWRVRAAALSAACLICSSFAGGERRVKTVQQQIAVARNHCEQVIEIVGHSPGELADRFHFLRLQFFGSVGMTWTSVFAVWKWSNTNANVHTMATNSTSWFDRTSARIRYFDSPQKSRADSTIPIALTITVFFANY